MLYLETAQVLSDPNPWTLLTLVVTVVRPSIEYNAFASLHMNAHVSFPEVTVYDRGLENPAFRLKTPKQPGDNNVG